MMEGWKEVELGDICIIKGGKRLPKGHQLIELKSSHPYIRARDIKKGKISFTQPVYINDGTFNLISRYIINTGDVLITIVGANIGDTAFVRNEFDGANLTENAVKLVSHKDRVSPKFLNYALVPNYMKYYFQTVASGAAQDKLGIYKIKKIKINLPPLPTQQKIASILSAYDDLIENNLKRIQLLEEKARLTYEEWFVRMKFPGHEVVEWDEVSGLPVGWEKVTFLELVNVNPKTTIKKGTIAPYVPMKSLSTSSMVIQPIEEKAVSGGTKFKNGDTLFARITPCLENGKTGFVQFMKNKDQIATGSTEYIILRETEYCGKYFIYCTSRTEEFRQNAIKSMVGSDGRQRVKTDCFEKYLVNYATSDIRNIFEQLSDQIFKSIQIIVNQNQLLKEARDLLLPRLMSGMIDVEALEIGELLQKI